MINPPRCEACSQPFEGALPVFICPNCRGEGYAFGCAVAAVRSRGVARDLIHRLKYGREIWIGRVLAGFLERGLGDERFRGLEFDNLVPVPLHALRERERGFNQSVVLSEALARRTGIPVAHVLERVRYTTTQTRLGRAGRRQNLRDAFGLRKNADVTGRDLLLIDDVLTTGATLDACAGALLDAGAASVHCLTVARG